MNDENIDFCEDKYTDANFITRRLVDNFFCTVACLVPDEARRVLEVGCGKGFSTQYLMKLLPGRYFEASDSDNNLVVSAQERNPQIQFSQESIYELKREKNSFDIVVALEVFEHLQDPSLALREMMRVSSRYVIISVPNEPLWRVLNFLRGKYVFRLGNTPGHINHWTPRGIEGLVGKHCRVIRRQNPFPWTVLLAAK